MDGRKRRAFTGADVDEWATAEASDGRLYNHTTNHPGSRKRGQISKYFQMGVRSSYNLRKGSKQQIQPPSVVVFIPMVDLGEQINNVIILQAQGGLTYV